MNNVAAFKGKAAPLKTIESAKQAQRLVEHLEEVRNARNYLTQHPDAKAASINLIAPVHESLVPRQLLETKQRQAHPDNGTYRFDSDGWIQYRQMVDGTFDCSDPQSHWNGRGRFPTIGRRVMDGIRAAVNEEVEATEKAIRNLGYEVPEAPCPY